MRKKLITRIFSGYLFIILSVILINGILFSNYLYKFYIEQLNERLFSIALSIKPQADILLNAEGDEKKHEEAETARNILQDTAEKLKHRITIIDRKGSVLFDSEMDYHIMDNHLNRAELSESDDNRFGYSVRYSTSIRRKMLYHAVENLYEGQKTGYIRISVPLSDVYTLAKKWIFNIALLGILVTVLSVLAAYFLSRDTTKKLSELISFFYNVREKDSSLRIISRPGDELYPLHSAVNSMLDSISQKYSEKKPYDSVCSIIQNIEDASVIINNNDEIYSGNKTFACMFNEHYKNRKYWEIFRDSDLNSLIEHTRKTRMNSRAEIKHDNRFFVCNSIFLPNIECVLLIFSDISDIKAFEKQKREFYANASHELKTPLTAIKGFAETLYEEVEEKHKGYLDIIQKHVDRLIKIVKDLIMISELDQHKSGEDFEYVDLREVLDNIIVLFKYSLEKKHLNLNIDISDDTPGVLGCADKIEQMLINLIDNAVRYTKKGSISVSVRPENGHALLTVRDTGIGISDKDLPRIFDRFFVAEKSRSRENAGSGLGLSIVKQIVLLHNGKINVESSINSGTVFTIHLPASEN